MNNPQQNRNSEPQRDRQIPHGWVAVHQVRFLSDTYEQLVSQSLNSAVTRINAGKVAFTGLIKVALTLPARFEDYLKTGVDMRFYQTRDTKFIRHLYDQAKSYSGDNLTHALDLFRRAGFRVYFFEFGHAMRVLPDQHFLALVGYFLREQNADNVIQRLAEDMVAANFTRHGVVMSSSLPDDWLKKYLNAAAERLPFFDAVKLVTPYLDRFG